MAIDYTEEFDEEKFNIAMNASAIAASDIMDLVRDEAIEQSGDTDPYSICRNH